MCIYLSGANIRSLKKKNCLTWNNVDAEKAYNMYKTRLYSVLHTYTCETWRLTNKTKKINATDNIFMPEIFSYLLKAKKKKNLFNNFCIF